MTYPAGSLKITDGQLWMCDDIREMVEDITGECPDHGNPLEMVAYLRTAQAQLGGDRSTLEGQLNAVMHAELDQLRTAIEDLLGGRTHPQLH
jgi:hypothetical protein